MKKKIISSTILFAALIAFSIISCDSGGTSSNTGTPIIITGPMIKGSVIINGIHFEDGLAEISEDELSATSDDLDDGMIVKVKGTVNDDGVTGTAEFVEVENEVRGAIDSILNDTIVVLGQTVIVDGATVYANVANLDSLGVDDYIEVHGLRVSGNMINATRIEKFDSAVDEEVRGIVADKTSETFSIYGAGYSFDEFTEIEGGITFNDGDLVEVELNGNYAEKIELEDAEDAEYESDGDYEIEGYVNNFTSHPGTFYIGTQEVQTTDSTEFEGGASSDLMNDVKIEAKGVLDSGVLLASEISFEESIKIAANADGNGSANVLGLTILTNSLTEFSDNLPAGIASITAGDGLEIKGSLNPDNSITATEIEKLSDPVPVDEIIVQGIITAYTSPNLIVIAGLDIDLTSVASIELDDSISSLTITQFFNSIILDRTVVRAKGTFSSSTLTADEVEIE